MSQTTIGVDLGGTNVRAALVRDGEILSLKAKRIRSQGSRKDVFEDLCEVLDQVFQGKVRGIGLGVPSLVDPKRGLIVATTNIRSWRKIPIKDWLMRKYQVPVHLENDANCFALGESVFGSTQRFDNSVGLIIGTGLGAGIIIDHKIYSGVFCGAGEFGMIPYKDSILEHYASGQFFAKKGFSGEEAFASAKRGNRVALKAFSEYGEHLGFAIKTVLYSLAPEAIVLGGSVSLAYPYFKKSLEKSLKDFKYPDLLKQVKIKVSQTDNVAILGASYLLKGSR